MKIRKLLTGQFQVYLHFIGGFRSFDTRKEAARAYRYDAKIERIYDKENRTGKENAEILKYMSDNGLFYNLP